MSGLLWFDDTKAELLDKVIEAAKCYEKRTGQRSTHCYVHSGELDGNSIVVNHIRVEEDNAVLKHHYWIGQEDTTHLGEKYGSG
jgi:hypothetical protein